jgi:hypothetical protein
VQQLLRRYLAWIRIVSFGCLLMMGFLLDVHEVVMIHDDGFPPNSYFQDPLTAVWTIWSAALYTCFLIALGLAQVFLLKHVRKAWRFIFRNP